MLHFIHIGTEISVRPRHVKSSVNLEDLLNSSGEFSVIILLSVHHDLVQNGQL